MGYLRAPLSIGATTKARLILEHLHGREFAGIDAVYRTIYEACPDYRYPGFAHLVDPQGVLTWLSGIYEWIHTESVIGADWQIWEIRILEDDIQIILDSSSYASCKYE